MSPLHFESYKIRDFPVPTWLIKGLVMAESYKGSPTNQMPSTLEHELVEIYEQEVEKLVETEDKYRSILGVSEISAVVQAFRFTLEHGVDKVNVQMLYDMIDDRSEE